MRNGKVRYRGNWKVKGAKKGKMVEEKRRKGGTEQRKRKGNMIAGGERQKVEREKGKVRKGKKERGI
jgi:hypothetical protein